MRRREFIAGLSGTAMLAPAMAQSRPLVGLMGVGSARNSDMLLAPIREGLRRSGLVEGQDFDLEQRWAEGEYQRFPDITRDFVRRGVSVIIAGGGTQSALAARSVTQTVPIVFNAVADPVAAGLVRSLQKPEGNLTGVSNLAGELGPKRLELLQEILASSSKPIAILANPANRAVTPSAVAAIQASAKGTELPVIYAESEGDFEAALLQASSKASGLVIVPDLVFIDGIRTLKSMSARHRVPSIFQFREFAAAGGLMTYGGSFGEAMHQVGLYAGRLLRGTSPSDLPVQQFTRIELVVNLQTIKTLGLSLPSSLGNRADELIE